MSWVQIKEVQEFSEASNVMMFLDTQIERAQIGQGLEEERFALTRDARVEASREKPRLAQRSWRFLKAIASIPWGIFRVVSLIGWLALLAAVPVVNVYVLGVLIETQGRAAREKRWLVSVPGFGVATELGTVALWIWLWLAPIRILASYARDAHFIEAGSATDVRLSSIVVVAQVAIGSHLLLAILAGGHVWNFVNPVINPIRVWTRLRRGEMWRGWDQIIERWQAELQPMRYFTLGVKGLIGAAVWLIPPTVLFALPEKPEGGPLILMLVGGFLLACVLTWMPALQTEFARDESLRSYFRWRDARERLARRPGLWAVGMLIIFALGLPLYLFKIFALPQDAMWLVTVVYVLSVLPTKYLSGWLVRLSDEGPRARWFWRYPMYLLQTTVCGLFVFLIFFTQNIAQDGKLALFKQHLFVLPF